MDEVLVFQQDPFQDLGFFAEVLEKQGANYRVIRLFDGEMREAELKDVGLLIVLGGPMGADDEESFPFLRWEKRIIRAAIDEAVPVLGISLGAQLIASTLGTKVFHGSVKEIGWSPISITPYGQMDSSIGYLPENATVFQWHGDGFDLPAGAIRFASSAHYSTQAFRFGKTVYGLQFHLEVTPPMIERWRPAFKRFGVGAVRFARQNSRDTPSYAPTLKYYAEKFVAELIRRVSRLRNGKIDGGPVSA